MAQARDEKGRFAAPSTTPKRSVTPAATTKVPASVVPNLRRLNPGHQDVSTDSGSGGNASSTGTG